MSHSSEVIHVVVWGASLCATGVQTKGPVLPVAADELSTWMRWAILLWLLSLGIIHERNFFIAIGLEINFLVREESILDILKIILPEAYAWLIIQKEKGC